MVRADPAPSGGHTWLVLQRDLSVWLRTVPQSTLATMVLDLTDRGTRAVEAGSTVGDSLRETLRLAARKPAQGMEPRIPDRIQAPASIVAALRSELGQLEREAGFRPDTIVEEVTPDEGAEWVFDDVITQMAGRRPPDERLQPEDATLLYEQARRFMEAAPWTRFASDDAFIVELKIGSQRMEGIVAVVGHQFSQPGRTLMAGRKRTREVLACCEAA